MMSPPEDAGEPRPAASAADAPMPVAAVVQALIAAGDVAYRWDFASDRLSCIGAVGALFGRHGVPDSGEALEARVLPEDLPRRSKALEDHLESRDGSALDCDFRLSLGDGEPVGQVWLHDRARVERDAAGRPVALAGIWRRIDRLKHREAMLSHLADFDEMTGHFNRKRLLQALEEVLADSRQLGLPGAYLSIGIDKLSLINDAYGPPTADAVIVALGQRIGQFLQPDDLLGRVGGDIFGLLLRNCPERQAGETAEAILQAMRSQPVETPSGRLHVSVSIGAIAFPAHLRSAVEAATRAEAAMQTAKRQGRDCFHLYRMSEEQRREQRRDMLVGEQVKQALSDDRLVFAFQPMVSAVGHEVVLYECLLRLRLPDGSVETAGRFMPAVERLGLIRAIDRRVLELALAELRADDRVSLCVNVSGFTAADKDWLSLLVESLEGRPDMARRLVVEITETAATQDIGDTIQFAAVVRGLGCRLALDDFGSGFTSFRHLKALTVDVVKIDGSFARDAAVNEDDRTFVRTLVQLARGFGLTTVAECVETAEAAEALAAEGVDLLQGFHFARPTLERPWKSEGTTETGTGTFPRSQTTG